MFENDRLRTAQIGLYENRRTEFWTPLKIRTPVSYMAAAIHVRWAETAAYALLADLQRDRLGILITA